MFLAVTKRKVIDTRFQDAVAEDLTADPPIAARAEVAEVSHLVVAQIYCEDAPSQVAENMDNDVLADYYNIKIDGVTLAASLHPVSLKTGVRRSAASREIAEIEADGLVVGSAAVDA